MFGVARFGCACPGNAVEAQQRYSFEVGDALGAFGAASKLVGGTWVKRKRPSARALIDSGVVHHLGAGPAIGPLHRHWPAPPRNGKAQGNGIS